MGEKLYRVLVRSQEEVCSTVTTPSQAKIRAWGKNLQEQYANHSLIVQSQTATGEWQDWRLLEDF